MPAKRGREDTPLATAGKAVKADDVLSLINAYDASLEQRREQAATESARRERDASRDRIIAQDVARRESERRVRLEKEEAMRLATEEADRRVQVQVDAERRATIEKQRQMVREAREQGDRGKAARMVEVERVYDSPLRVNRAAIEQYHNAKLKQQHAKSRSVTAASE